MAPRPRVIINVAQSLNGMIAGPGGRRVLISSEIDLRRVHRLRAEVDAILVGANTIISDNPDLKVSTRYVDLERRPVRIVLDSKLKIPDEANVLDGSIRTLVFTSNQSRTLKNAEKIVLEPNMLFVENILEVLYHRGIRSLLVEGGKDVIRHFAQSGFVDEFYLYIGDLMISEGGLSLFDLHSDLRNIVKEISIMDKGLLLSLRPESFKGVW